MRRAPLVSLLLALLSFAVAVRANNDYPIVLVHGIFGWGRTEMFGFKYWGGFKGDLQEQLKAEGHTVHTAAVGPFSSNWDRACELYAQIKGGRVDYGETHSKLHGHARYGKMYPGMYPEWGEIGADGRVKKIHLIGHSMGGQTIRMLAQLLAKGSAGSPTPEAFVNSSSSLFAGGKDWIHSITTVSTPNQGTLMSDALLNNADMIKNLLISVFGVLDIGGSTMQDVYDVKMDHWGVQPKLPSETLSKYVERVFASNLLRGGIKDICLWDLSIDGAKKESEWVETLPSIYYYGVSNSDTTASINLKGEPIQVPNVMSMQFYLQPFSVVVGGRYGPEHGFGTEWQPNDGLVNTISMGHDLTGKKRAFDGTSVIGLWNVYPTIRRMDHLAMVGMSMTSTKAFYTAHANLLRNLPVATSVSVASSTTPVQQATAPAAMVTALFDAMDGLNSSVAMKMLPNVKTMCRQGATGMLNSSVCKLMLGLSNASRTRSLRG